MSTIQSSQLTSDKGFGTKILEEACKDLIEILEGRRKNSKEQKTSKEQKENKGQLSKTNLRKILEIVNDAEDLRNALLQIAYLVSRNEGWNNELGELYSKLQKRKDTSSLSDYLKVVVMGYYIYEELEKAGSDGLGNLKRICGG
ncbi:hypothetical protein B9Q00_09380 [Candidatus Marsarchaeota G1 archaeon OSP_C]|uniref:Uncharacterized protein n=2 Tax=Candidatus Marsarchaeota group 1 TaxID=2203770 RepID=A0A2R6ALH8_9ARCH|nr:MAG: hypothetical protein B9Q00_09380 [Candidatus Marsarchaeota G1 archaeon OSP_C]